MEASRHREHHMGEAAAKHLAPQICHHGWQIPEDTAAPCAQHDRRAARSVCAA